MRKQLKVLLLATTMLVAPASAKADPIITPTIASALISAGLSSAAATAIGSAVSAVVTAVALTGVQQVVGGLFASDADRATVSSSVVSTGSTKLTTRQALPAQVEVRGRAIVGGAVNFQEVDPPYLTMGLILAGHAIDGIDYAQILDNQVTFDADTYEAQGSPYNTGSTVFLKGHVRLGEASETVSPLLLGRYPNVLESFATPGWASAVLEAKYGTSQDQQKELYGSNFQVLWFVRGKPIFDPRRDAVLYSENPALHIADLLQSDWAGQITADQIDFDSFARAADHCDQKLPTPDGEEPRYALNGALQRDANWPDVLGQMLTSCRGRLTLNGGKIGLRVGVPEEPELTISQNIIAGGFEMVGGTPRADLVNKVQTRFVSLDREYEAVLGPLVQDDEAIAADGQVYEKGLDLPFEISPWRAQRHAHAFLKDARIGRAARIPIDGNTVEAWEVEPGMVVRTSFTSPILKRHDGVWIVEEIEPSDDLSISALRLSEYDPSIYAIPAYQPFEVEAINVEAA